ncbi:unnamed protein product [Sympodiomycopsis kandeliae]
MRVTPSIRQAKLASRTASLASRQLASQSGLPVASRALSSATQSSGSATSASTRSNNLFSRSPLLPQRRSYSEAISDNSLVQTTTLPNGIRVATEGTPGHFAAAGVYIDAGSRYERPWIAGESGVSHLLDRMAFKSTSNRSSSEMTQVIEKLGGNIMCTSSRETILYQSAMFHQDLSTVLSILADTIQCPLLSEEELEMQKEAALWEIREIWNKPELINPELLHMVAYRDNTLGNPLLCPEESLQVMTTQNLKDFINTWYTPERMVVAGAGVEHEELVALTRRYFGNTQPKQSVLSSSSSHANKPSPSLAASFSTTAKKEAQAVEASSRDLAHQKAVYTGGEHYIEREDLDFNHVYLAFEGVSIHDEDIYSLAVLQVLLGGGSAFSAGGPGKGMYSRLYNVLNRHHSVDYCASSIHPYVDSGLFAIAIAFEPSVNATIGKILSNEITSCLEAGLPSNKAYHFNSPKPITPSDLTRAKNQLKSSLMMALESRLVQVEDLGRQIQSHNQKMSIDEMCSKIDQVDMNKIRNVAKRVFEKSSGKQATVVAQGRLQGLGDIRQILHQKGIGATPTQA